MRKRNIARVVVLVLVFVFVPVAVVVEVVVVVVVVVVDEITRAQTKGSRRCIREKRTVGDEENARRSDARNGWLLEGNARTNTRENVRFATEFDILLEDSPRRRALPPLGWLGTASTADEGWTGEGGCTSRCL